MSEGPKLQQIKIHEIRKSRSENKHTERSKQPKESKGKSYRDQKKKQSKNIKTRNYISTLVEEASLVFDIAMIFLIHLL